jgi:branched-chain amino acid transport system substrate-binding protein
MAVAGQMAMQPRERGTAMTRGNGWGSSTRAGLAWLTVALLATACGASGPAASSNAAHPKDVLIGVPISLTGVGAGFGVPQLHAAQDEVAAINAAGGIKDLGGAKLELDVADDQSSPTVAAQLLRQMAANGVSAFIGPVLSSVLAPNVPVIQALHVPQFTPAAGDTITDNNAGYIFRSIERASGFAASMSGYLKSLERSRNAPIKRMAIVDVSLEPGPSVATSFAGLAKPDGWQTQTFTYDEATADFSPLVSKIAAYQPQVVVGYQDPNDAVLFAKAVAAQKWRPGDGFGWIFGGEDLNSFKASLGTSVNGWLDAAYTAGLDTSTYPASVQAIARKYAAQYHVPLNGNQGSLAAIVGLVADAVSAARSTNPQKVAAAARKLSFASASGSEYPFPQSGGVKFAANQDNVGFIPPIIQLEGTTADPTQIVVSPSSLVTGQVVWPVRS